MALTLETLTVILIGLSFISAENTQTQIAKTIVDPTTCGHTLEDRNVPHESDCSKYYRCVYGKKVPKICPEKMLFNQDIGNCDLYYNVECSFEKNGDDNLSEQNYKEAIENLTGSPRFAKKSKAATTVSDSDQKSTTLADDTTITTKAVEEAANSRFVYEPHENNARAYYKIENGARKLMFCDEDMIFSFEMEICARP